MSSPVSLFQDVTPSMPKSRPLVPASGSQLHAVEQPLLSDAHAWYARTLSKFGTQAHRPDLAAPTKPVPDGLVESASPPAPRMAPRVRFEQDKFTSLQKWEGVVIKVDRDTFWARLLDLTGGALGEEEAEFPLEEVPAADADLLREGAIFYWNIGYRDLNSSGQRIRASEVRFKRTAPPTPAERVSAKRRAAHLVDSLGWKRTE